MTLFIKPFFCSCCVICLLRTTYSQDLYDYSNSLKYADYLFKTNQFKLASAEYERIVFLEPKDTLSRFKLIQSYRYLTEYTTAINRIEKYFQPSLNNLPKKFSDEYVRNLLYDNQFQKATDFLLNINTMDIGVKTEYQLGILMMQYRWTEAGNFADEHLGVLATTGRFDNLNNIIKGGLNTRYKSPFLAASISVIVPGGGKVYSGQWADAIYSFLIVTSSTWLTYKSFQKNGVSFNSFLIGSFALSFHSANIYGSVKSAKRHNQKINQALRSDIENILLNDNAR